MNATGMFIVPSATGLRLIFTDFEASEGEYEEGKPTIQELQNIQAEVLIDNGLAKWIRDYIDEYLKQLPEAHRGQGEVRQK